MFSSIKLYIYLAAIAGLLSLGFYGGYRFELSAYEKLALSYEQAKNIAIQQALDLRTKQEQIKDTIAQAQALEQQKILNQTKDRLREIQKYVSNTCITWGAIRLHDSFVLNRSPTELSLPTGKLDGSCSGITARQLMEVVLNNYGKFKQNASQLTALQQFYQKIGH